MPPHIPRVGISGASRFHQPIELGGMPFPKHMQGRDTVTGFKLRNGELYLPGASDQYVGYVGKVNKGVCDLPTAPTLPAKQSLNFSTWISAFVNFLKQIFKGQSAIR